MKIVRSALAILMVLMLSMPVVWADDVAELKIMVEQLRNDYEAKIQSLENKIAQMEKNQTIQVEQKVAQLTEQIKKDIKEDEFSVDYVGRYDGPFGKGGVVIDNPSGFGQVSLGGYMDHEFANFDDTDSTFDQHRWILNVGAQLGERLRFYSEYEIEHGGPDANNSGDGEAKVEQAYFDYLIRDWVNFRGGAVLVPFGRTNIYHDSDLRDLTSRPIVARDVIPTTWTESGVGFFGEVNPAIGDYEDLVINYEAYVINGLDDGFTDTGLGGGRGSLSSDNNNNKAVVARTTFSPMLGQEVGLSGYYGKYNAAGDAITGGALDFLSVFGPLEFEGEYAYFDVDNPAGSDVAENYQGYYLQANYHFWPEFLSNTFLGEKFDHPTLTLVGRYGWAEIDDDSDGTVGNNEQDRWTIGLNYRPVESWVFKTEYQWNDSENEALENSGKDGFMWSVAMGF